MGFRAIFCCGGSSDRKGKQKIGSWRVFSLKELHAATNNFNYDNKLGEGGIGSVYWGQLWDGSQIAVKRLKIWSERSETEFPIEVEVLGRIRHKDLLCLRGYCNEGQERLIVYDYMPNLSLHSHLHGQHSLDCLLDWKRRMNIALGAAEGIEYLHQHSVIHRDIKARNVLLDSNFNARVADFGLAKLIPEGSLSPDLAPEYVMLGKDARSCDVYNYGILLLELVSGKKATNKLELWALPLAQEEKFEEIVDPKLNGNFVKSELRKAVLVGLICTKNAVEKRPTMLEVVDLLKAESKEKMSNLENDEMFKRRPAGSDELSGEKDIKSSDNVSCEERDIKVASDDGSVSKH